MICTSIDGDFRGVAEMKEAFSTRHSLVSLFCLLIALIFFGPFLCRVIAFCPQDCPGCDLTFICPVLRGAC